MRKKFDEIRLLIFDLDDTLYPEIEYVRSGFKEVSKKISDLTGIGQRKIYSNLVKEFQADRKEVFNRLLKGLNIYSPELLAELVNDYRYHMPRLRPFNDVKFNLRILKRKYNLAIITDGESSRQLAKIKALKLAHYFQKIICTGDGNTGYQKPSEKPFLDMIRHFKLKPNEAAYIADNIGKDFYGPNRIGMLTIRIKREVGIYKNIRPKNKLFLPHFEIRSLNELNDILTSK